ncbi:hypothetical protein ELH91_10140 [Rhizobium leguminosarum]|uniref:hypothetical protein n=1 Tax=Rhizobium leguminosarum TaxID=384 RepID=UPI00102FEE28|nr:hypothetical protein [Rhizobium leguminosarum]TAY17100.1 hypothetical protein ELH91_10140 [Rhizobium leguminosarum]
MKTRKADATVKHGSATPKRPSIEELDEVYLDAADLRELLNMCGLVDAVSDGDWVRVERMGPIAALVDPLTRLVEHYRFEAAAQPH